jgi:hypothetical protein
MANPVDVLVHSISEATMPTCTAFGPSTVMDATVPQWRFSVRGADAIRGELSKWYPAPGRTEVVQRAPFPGGELLELCRTWDEPEGPISVHQAYLIEVVGEEIASLKIWCGGRWTAAELADMAAAQDQADKAAEEHADARR